ncbi:hypothetical protein AcV5_005862 [Taiwanofungus camphoratus]|nr:hypothetical protein AcW2_004309 [Antrodia cinnamomea]KAI0933816.1 hypothetical protein AcV5_005862 [Antrodia cinnamomea]KAI0948389.1 hypothetical protein AcV7_009147 [Antrodia cinnamomea]
MPRRPAPTPLRLIEGPLPSRGQPKHTLPSFPRPAYHPPVHIVRGPAPRKRALVILEPEEPHPHMSHAQLPPLAIPAEEGYEIVASSPTSAGSGSSEGQRSRASGNSVRTDGGRSRSPSPPSVAPIRAPWDRHARGFSLDLDLEAILAPPRPVAINPAPVTCGRRV